MADKPFMPPSFTEQFNRVPPDILYHYTGQAGLIGIVQKEELWATKIQYMNDATEFGLAVRLAKEVLTNMIESTHHTAERSTCTELMRSLEEIGEINIFAACFCEKPDLLSQWRGYAGGQYAYALGFDTDRLIQVAEKDNFVLGPCIYDEAIQRKIIWEAVIDCIQKGISFPAKTNWGFKGPLADVLFRCGVFFKDQAFVDEKEWRIVSPTVWYDNGRINFKPGGSTLVPYYQLPIKHEDGLPVRQIVVGPCPHMELAKSAVTLLLMTHGNKAPLIGQQIAFDSKIPFRNW